MQIETLERLVDAVKAASTNPTYIIFVPEWFVEQAKDYFQEINGKLWFDHPALLRVRAVKIPNDFDMKDAYLLNKKDFDREVWRSFCEL